VPKKKVFTDSQLKDTKKILREEGEKCGKTPDENTFKFLIEEYKICHQKATHYDRLSWVVGAFLVGASSLVTAVGLRLNGEVGVTAFLKRTPFALLAAILIWAWWLIYQRNRGWVEMLNERIKDIERAFGIYGIGSYFSVGSWQMGMERENLERTHVAQELKLSVNGGSVFRISSWAMHLILKLIVIGLTVVIGVLWLLPLVLWAVDP
jgi:hypothetical protein